MKRHTWVAAALGAAVVATLTAAPAHAAPTPPAPVDCPTALPTTEAVDGLTGTGWTVERGTTPETFTATVLGRVSDGIAPGIDMIMAQLDSPALQRAGGVWAGMSGSPVYTADGRLIGSVSYGLAASSPIAGITPAESLETLLTADPDDASARARSRVAVKRDVAQRLASTGDVSTSVAQQGFTRLRTPILVNGASGAAAQKLAARLQQRTGVPVVLGGTSAPTASAAAPAMAGGDNFAVAAAYGDATLGGVGTTTFTCRGEAVAFGHPFTDAGAVTYSAHRASAVYVQPDPTNGPFKVANFGDVVGTVDRDRTLGLRADLTRVPTTLGVVARLTRVETGATRTGTTRVVDPKLAADAAAFHALYDVDRMMGSAASTGTARLTLSVTGRRANGAPFRVLIGNTFTSRGAVDQPLDQQVADWVYGTVAPLVDQPFEPVTLTGIRLDGTVSSRATTWRAPTIAYWRAGRWQAVPRGGVVASVGETLGTRLTFSAYRAPTTRTELKRWLTVPASARYRDLGLVLRAGGLDRPGQTEPTSMSALLTQLTTQPRSDEVEMSYVDLGTDRVLASGRVRASAPVEPFTRVYGLSVR